MFNRFKQLSAFHSIKTDKRGAAALIAIIILTVFVVIISAGLGLIAITNLEIGFSEQRSSDVLISAESCVEETMIQLSKNASYAGGSLTVGDVACTMVVTGVPCGTCTINVEASAVGYTRNIEAAVTVSGQNVSIDSWKEID